MKSPVKIGTRGSKLALYQSEIVQSKLKASFPSLECEFVKIRTKGDIIQRGAIDSIGPGIFTREIEEALLSGEIDLAVHSAKDLATELPEGLEIGAVLMREDPRDCLVAREGKTLKELPRGAKIGTSSLRRRAQVKRLRPDLETLELRGNVDTRLRKVKEGEYDGIVIAHAGLKRLGLGDAVTEVFEEDYFLPQAGQGALAIEIRKGNQEIKELVKSVNHEPAFIQVSAERSFLRRLEGGCQIPAGVTSKLEANKLTLKGAIFSLEGDRVVMDAIAGSVSEAEKLGRDLAEKLIKAGGNEILKAIRNGTKA